MRRQSSGFTLIELIIAVVVFGVILVMLAPFMTQFLQLREMENRDRNSLAIQRVSSAITSFARNTNNGRLPTPYSGNGMNSTIFDPNDTSASGLALSLEMRNSGVVVNSINDDGSISRNVRVYQLVPGLIYTMPYYFQTGTQIALTYDVGAIYQTTCGVQSSCNTSIPGDSGAFNASNFTTWIPSGNDYAGVVISTLAEQKQMLSMTISRTNTLRDKLSSEFNARLRMAAANSDQNYYPLPTNSGAPNLSGRNPVTNMGCHNGWYKLDAANVNILDSIGLSREEFGSTAWGGSIEYCQDYDPTAPSTATAGLPPHYSALRLNKNLTAAAPPTGVIASDLVITF